MTDDRTGNDKAEPVRPNVATRLEIDILFSDAPFALNDAICFVDPWFLIRLRASRNQDELKARLP